MSAVPHVLSVVLDARDTVAAVRLLAALESLCAKDPALGLESGADNDFGLKGVSEAQLEWVVLHLQRQPDLVFKASRPQVLYRETITRGCDWSYTHKQRDPAQYAKLHIALTPEEFLSAVIGDLNSRRGLVQGLATHGAVCAVTATLPLARAIGYENTLRTLTRGSGASTMAFDRYEQAPPDTSGDDAFPMAAALRA